MYKEHITRINNDEGEKGVFFFRKNAQFKKMFLEEFLNSAYASIKIYN